MESTYVRMWCSVSFIIDKTHFLPIICFISSGENVSPPSLYTLQPAAYPEQGYACEFTEAPPTAFQTECPICLNVLRNPHEVSCCGNVFCYTCITKTQEEASCCPSCRSKEYQSFHCKSLERSLKKLRVQCENHKDGCEWTGELGQYDSHLNLNSQLEQRMEGCEYAKIQCHNRCGMLIPRSQILLHEKEECSVNHTELERSLYIQKLKHELHQKDKRIVELESESTKSRKEVQKLLREIGQKSERIAELEQESLTTAVIPVQRTVPNFGELQNSNQDYVSEPFYTHPEGYKMCLLMWPNGYGSGKNTHVSLFTCFVKGENDKRLKWPFSGHITVQLVDQVHNRDHRERVIHYDGDDGLSCGQRLTTGYKSKGLGIEKLISHESLFKATCQYLKDDCLKIRITKVEFDN